MAGRGPDARFGTLVKGLGLLSPQAVLGNIRAYEITLTTVESWELSEQGYKEKNNAGFPAWLGRASSAEGRPELQAADLPFLRK